MKRIGEVVAVSIVTVGFIALVTAGIVTRDRILIEYCCWRLSSEDSNGEEGFISIAVMDGLDEFTHTHVANVLLRNGISSSIGGSVVYELAVPRGAANTAIRLLRDSALDMPGSIKLVTTNGILWIKADRSECFTVNVHKPCSEVEKDATLKNQREIAAILKADEIRQKIPPFQILDHVDFVVRRFATKDGGVAVGFDFEVFLSIGGNNKIAEFRRDGHVLHGGASVSVFGGIESWSGDSDAVAKNKLLHK